MHELLPIHFDDLTDDQLSFMNAGIHFIGSFQISTEVKTGKSFICIFTRAMHLESPYSFTTNNWQTKVGRSITKIGTSKPLLIDYTTYFVGARYPYSCKGIK